MSSRLALVVLALTLSTPAAATVVTVGPAGLHADLASAWAALQPELSGDPGPHELRLQNGAGVVGASIDVPAGVILEISGG